METKAYLDTHLVVWLYDREIGKLSEQAIEIIETQQLFLSEFVRLELQYLKEINRLTISPDQIIRFLMDEIDIQMCEIPISSIITEALTIGWTRDPFDRLITANASFGNHILLTKDEEILAHYPYACF